MGQEINVDYEFSDLEGDLGILESNLENCVNVTNYDDFDKLLLKRRVDQKLVQQAMSCLEYAACKEQMGNAFGVIPLSPLMVYQRPKTDHAYISDILTLPRAVKDSNCPNYMGIRIPVSSKLKNQELEILFGRLLGQTVGRPAGVQLQF